jgi:hypothetical protein
VTVQTPRGRVVLAFAASHFFRAAFDTIHALRGAPKLIVVGHALEVVGRFTVAEPGITRIA